MRELVRSSVLWAGMLALAVVPAAPATAQEPDAADQDSVGAPAVEPGAGNGSDRVAMTVTLEDQDGKKTQLGTLVIELYPEDAPKHVANFLKLVQENYYVGTTFHRIVPGFIVQAGDPISKSDWKSPRVGTGGPTYTLPPEIGRKNVRGAVAMARKQDEVNPNRESNGSQFYICLADLPALDRDGYTVFGQVVQGMDVVDKISRVRTAVNAEHRALQKVEITETKLVKP